MFQIDQLEIDRFDWRLVYCPLLKEPVDYVPDTVDLTQDASARDYWLICFEEAIDKVTVFIEECQMIFKKKKVIKYPLNTECIIPYVFSRCSVMFLSIIQA